MDDLVWILDREKGIYFGKKGISGSYIIPSDDIHFDPKTMAGRRIWVVLRGQEDRLLKLIKVKKVERITDGYYIGDYLITSEITESFKIVSSYAQGIKFKIPETQSLGMGVSQIGLNISVSACNIVRKSVQIKFTPPNEKLLSEFYSHVFPNDVRLLVRSSLRAIIADLTLEQIWSSGTGDKLGPFANFAYALILRRAKDQDISSIVKELKSLDPIGVLLEPKLCQSGFMDTKKRSSPEIDIEFTAIEPDKIYAREFLCLDTKMIDLEQTLNKTEHAEKIHQEMLKDVANYLIMCGITPYESGSIDLMYELGSGLNVFEIKSANNDNFLGQVAKGMFQLACYQNELFKNYQSLNCKLIINKIDNDELIDYVGLILSKFGFELLIYDPTKSWPNRIVGLTE